MDDIIQSTKVAEFLTKLGAIVRTNNVWFSSVEAPCGLQQGAWSGFTELDYRSRRHHSPPRSPGDLPGQQPASC